MSFAPTRRSGIAVLLPSIITGVAMLFAGNRVAHGGSPGGWTCITDPTGVNIDEVALARTSDGVLHIAWLRKNGNHVDLMHTAVAANGQVIGAPASIVTGWSTLNNPDLVVTEDGGLRVFFGGVRSDEASDPYSQGSLYTATSSASGANWKLDNRAVAQSTSVYASPVGAGIALDGRPVTAWATTYGLSVHFGLDPRSPDRKFQDACCAYQPDVATDTTRREVVLGWYSNASRENGLLTRTIAPVVEPPQFVPDSATADRNSSLSLDQRMPVLAREGGGVYVAYCAGYPACQSVNLWWHRSPEAFVIAKAPGARLVNIAPGPEGRLWVMWVSRGRLYAMRTNREATRFGAIVSFEPPKGTDSIWKLKGEGSNGPLDVLVAVSTPPKDLATWHTQVLPGLTITAKPTTIYAAYGATVTLAVSDAGDPVPGATITVAGKRLTTNGQGVAFYLFAAKGTPGSLTAIATKGGYTNASLRLTAK